VSDEDDSVVGTVVLLSGDLMFASRVRSAADAAGLEFRLAGRLPNEQAPENRAIRWVIVDLATRSGVVDGLVEQCTQICPDATVIAFGPHVQVAKIEAARAAGITNVMTRGQFDRSIATLFKPT
jgi:hypothetical protein